MARPLREELFFAASLSISCEGVYYWPPSRVNYSIKSSRNNIHFLRLKSNDESQPFFNSASFLKFINSIKTFYLGLKAHKNIYTYRLFQYSLPKYEYT